MLRPTNFSCRSTIQRRNGSFRMRSSHPVRLLEGTISVHKKDNAVLAKIVRSNKS